MKINCKGNTRRGEAKMVSKMKKIRDLKYKNKNRKIAVFKYCLSLVLYVK